LAPSQLVTELFGSCSALVRHRKYNFGAEACYGP
jgi:hypothetical protein